MVIKDPESIEYVLRAEGKYPARDTGISDRYAWLYKNKIKLPVPFTLE